MIASLLLRRSFGALDYKQDKPAPGHTRTQVRSLIRSKVAYESGPSGCSNSEVGATGGSGCRDEGGNGDQCSLRTPN